MAQIRVYTSFDHFVKEWRELRFPNERYQGMQEAEKVEQLPNESIDSYYERYKRIYDKLGMLDTYKVDWFISGLHDEEIKDECIKHNFGDEHTIDAVRIHALSFQQKLGIGKAMRDKRKKLSQGQNRHVSSTKNDHKKNSKSNADKGKGPAKHTTHRRSNVAAATSNQQSRSPPYKRTNNGGVNKGARSTNKPSNNSKQSTNAPANASSNSTKPPGQPITWNEKCRIANEWQRKMGVSGCFACMQNHYVRRDYSMCSSTCPFCLRKYEGGKNRHWSYECSKRPKTAKDIEAAVQKAATRQ